MKRTMKALVSPSPWQAELVEASSGCLRSWLGAWLRGYTAPWARAGEPRSDSSLPPGPGPSDQGDHGSAKVTRA